MDAHVIQTVVAAMDEVAQAADAARHAAAAGDQAVTLTRCSAVVAVAMAAVNVIRAIAPADPKDEWKESRATSDRFDKLLVDLRKVGFSFVTAILSGATFFFIQDPTKPVPDSVKFATFSFILVLVLVLYVIDHVHQVMLQTAVNRAQTLEG